MSATMGEIKSVKVDNWGVFFLQKLQNFFNKTDYCDLTLQFHDNSQLKVHRLVLSACTDYFNVLEQTCEMIDDALIMPNELQADVVVPIVNFMYTGTLEFELKMYGKLLRTAKEMNMTVLLKLLEAHRRTMEGVNRSQRPPSPKAIRRRGVSSPAGPVQYQSQQPQRRILATSNAATLQRRVVQTKTISTSPQFRQQIGSTSLLRTGGQQNSEYNTLPLKNQQQQQQQQSTSPFEQLRKGYNNTKRPAPVSFETPPAKKPNIEDVKEFAEQQRMRKQIAAEYGDDPEYEGMMDDDIHNDDDDDDAAALPTSSGNAQSSKQQSQQQQQQPASATITFKQEQTDKPPTIVVKDTSNSKMNHAKIISEVLRQYPHLVKGNKNIKLKIVPSAGGQTHKIIVKKEPDNATAASGGGVTGAVNDVNNGQQSPQQKSSVGHVERDLQASNTKLPVQKTVSTSTTSTTAGIGSSGTASATPTQPGQKRRIDSKTMHALIALGAENTTGPWLCLRCGVNGRPISIPSYRSFRRHLINTHKESVDSALCEHCGWRSSNHRELHYHMQVEHKSKSALYTFPDCLTCGNVFLDNSVLNQHIIDSHPDENQQQCIYCNKIFAKEGQLYTHIKTYHKKQAFEDGVIDFSDEEYLDAQTGDSHHKSQIAKDAKVKILSDISIPSTAPILKTETDATDNDAIHNVASTNLIAPNTEEYINAEGELLGEPKFINADGNEVILTEEQRKEIMSQLNQEHEGGVVMLLNESVFPAEAGADATADSEVATEPITIGRVEPVGAETDGTNVEEFDDSQIYTELASAHAENNENKLEKNQDNDTGLEESKESGENLEWAENLISQDLANESTLNPEKKAKSQDDISKKLKELTGDWTDDENEETATEIAAMETETETETAAVLSEEQAEDDNDDNFDPEYIMKKKSKPQEESEIVEQEGEEKKSEAPVERHLTDDNDGSAAVSDKEDDVELAMKSMHKEEANTKLPDQSVDASDINAPDEEGSSQPETVTEVEEEEDGETEAIPQQSVDTKTDEKIEGAEAESSDKVEQSDIVIDTIPTKEMAEDDKIEESAIGLDDHKRTEPEAEVDAAAGESNIGTPLEDESVKKALIDELIAEANSSTKEHNEDENKDTSDSNIDAKVEIEMKDTLHTEDKVKSLISEWGEDDEADE